MRTLNEVRFVNAVVGASNGIVCGQVNGTALDSAVHACTEALPFSANGVVP